ncbi:hypothetical protein [Haloferula sargassicola]|uniref:Uncharacterized protein n=1 Tax=Haloferula sargassicola TaxID=490096 RepID=A0ABP9UPE0_9BACT
MTARALLLTTLLASGPLPADQVSLADGGGLTGEVAALDAASLTLRSPLAVEPLEIRLDRVREVLFPQSTTARISSHEARLELVNGDRMPCDVRSIGPETVAITTGYSDPLQVRRSSIQVMQLGIRPRRMIYQGPSEDDWNLSSAWKLEDGALVSQKPGAAVLKPGKLPASFSLEFELAWDGLPNLEVYLCSGTETPGRSKDNRYRLRVRNTRVELDRQSTGVNTFQPLGHAPIRLSDDPNHRATFEVRVDRANRKLQLLVNGEPALREMTDPVDAPEDSIVIFQSLNNDPGTLEVGPVMIRAWNPARERDSREERGDGEEDALIDIDGQRFSGQLIGTQEGGEGSVILFKSPHFPEPLEIPLDRVTTVFFRSPEESPPRSALLVGLPDAGLLSATGCVFEGDRARIDHPLLGRFTARRDALRALARRQSAKKADPDDEEASEEP